MINLKLVKEIVFVSYVPLTNRIIESYYFDDFTNMGVRVCYCDVSRCFLMQNETNKIEYNRINYFIANNYEQLASFIKERSSDDYLFVSLIPRYSESYKLFSLFTKCNTNVGYFGIDNISEFHSKDFYSKTGYVKYLYNMLLSKEGRGRLFGYIKDKYIKTKVDLNLINGYDVLFAAGEAGKSSGGVLGNSELKNAKIISINSTNYEKKQLIERQESIIRDPYVLFIDQYLPLHPDAKICNLPPLTPGTYYQSLNEYFDRVEQRFGCQVVIAAHPSAELYKTKDFFSGRRVLFGLTDLLSRDAEIVLTHASTSIAYIILFKKRMHLLSFRELHEMRPYFHGQIQKTAELLGCNWQYMDDDSEIDVVNSIDEKKYTEYKYTYLTSPESENMRSIDIIRKEFGR